MNVFERFDVSRVLSLYKLEAPESNMFVFHVGSELNFVLIPFLYLKIQLAAVNLLLSSKVFNKICINSSWLFK